MNQFYYEHKKNNVNLKHYIYKIGSYHYNWHKELELLMVLKGSIEVCKDGKNYILSEDDLILINSNTGHASLAVEDDSIAMVIHLDTSFFKEYYDKIDYLDFNIVSNEKTRYNKEFETLRECASLMMLNYNNEDIESKLLYEKSFYDLIYTLIKNFPPNKIQNNQYIQYKNTFDSVDKMIKYIDKNYKNKISLDDLANVCNYNRNYISAFFKSNLGINFYDYLTRIRLREATLELGSSNKVISEIALSNGFSDIKAFNNYFKSNFKKTPSEYRKQLNSNIVRNDITFKKEFILKDDKYINDKLNSLTTHKVKNDNTSSLNISNTSKMYKSEKDSLIKTDSEIEKNNLIKKVNLLTKKLKGISLDLENNLEVLKEIEDSLK